MATEWENLFGENNEEIFCSKVGALFLGIVALREHHHAVKISHSFLTNYLKRNL